MSKKKQQQVKCKTSSCTNPPAPGSKYCALCDMTVRFQRQVDRANRRGDTLGALVNTGLAFLFNGIREGRIAAPGSAGTPFPQPHFYRPPAPPPPPPPAKKDPFVILGLDPATATEKDVRRIQRGAAEMWHEDRGGSKQGHDRLSEINSAAEACIKSIRSRAQSQT